MNKDHKKNREETRRARPRLINLGMVLLLLIVLFEGYLLISWHSGRKEESSKLHYSDISNSFSMLRLHDKKLIAPLLLANVNVESEKLSGLKADLDRAIHCWENKGHVRTASVYLRDLNTGDWISINEQETFMPGSLLKLPIMITWLKEEEIHPGTLGSQLVMPGQENPLPVQAYEGRTIVPGKPYRVSELLEYMIVDSDNSATSVLIYNMNKEGFKRLFNAVGLTAPDLSDLSYTISAKDYSRFFGLMYNATYLGESLSEQALQLLSKSKFRDGLLRELPTDVVVAHKFGEHSIKEYTEFSESGIIYRDNEPYVLTVMTKGNDIKEQSSLISELSLLAFKKFPL